jgi:hypothetical protein
MKYPKMLIVLLLMCPFLHSFSQTFPEYIVIDEIADNYAELLEEFSGQANVYWIDGSDQSAIERISRAAEVVQIETLHIYVPTKPGAIVFSSVAITWNNVDELAEHLGNWGQMVTEQVVIHSDVVFSGEKGAILKQRLEEITGLVFTNQN